MSDFRSFRLMHPKKNTSVNARDFFPAWLAVGLALSLLPWSLAATEVYQWTDANGVVHFSQWAPTAPEKDVSKLDVDGSQPAGYNPEEDLYNVDANQKSMESLRSDMDARREAGKSQPPQTMQQVIQQTLTPEYGTWPIYPGSGQLPSNRPPLRPDRPVKPEQPIEPPSTWVPKKRGG